MSEGQTDEQSAERGDGSVFHDVGVHYRSLESSINLLIL
jgi:hypothetical protein